MPTVVMRSIGSFEATWSIGLAIFGVHLVGLGVLVFGSSFWSRILGALVVVAGAGYLVDAFGTILVPDYSCTGTGVAAPIDRCGALKGEPPTDRRLAA